MTRTDLILLAFLSEQPAHGWEIDRQLVEMGADLWAEYSRPNLYYALRKLERQKLIERIADPEDSRRKKYRVSAAGNAALRDVAVFEQLFEQRVHFDFDLVLGFAKALKSSKRSLADIIEMRRQQLQQELDRAQELLQTAEMTAGVSFGRIVVLRHRVKFLKSELDFAKWLEKSTPEDWASLTG